MYSRLSRGRSENVLGCPEITSQGRRSFGRQIKTSFGRQIRTFSGCHFKTSPGRQIGTSLGCQLGTSQVCQIGSLGYALGGWRRTSSRLSGANISWLGITTFESLKVALICYKTRALVIIEFSWQAFLRYLGMQTPAYLLCEEPSVF